MSTTRKKTTKRTTKSSAASAKKLGIALVLCVVVAWVGVRFSSGSGDSSSSAATTAATTVATQSSATTSKASSSAQAASVTEDGTYTSKDEVALYIHTYGKLPSNYISKTKAQKAGWDASAGNLDEVCPGMSIGGSKYWNDDAKLPQGSGITYTECDINYTGGHRGAERIIFSSDGHVYYTDDHYESFEQLY